MTTDPLRKVQSGEPFKPSASFHNAVVEMLRQTAVNQFNTGAPTDENPVLRAADCYIYNDSGQTLQKFQPAAIGTSVQITPPKAGFFDTPCVTAILPGEDELNVVVAAEIIKDESYGKGWMIGLVPAQIEVNDAAHQFVILRDGFAQWETSATTGWPIIWKESGTGTKYAYLLIGARSAAAADDPTSGCPTIPGLDTAAIVDAIDADFVLGVRDGCIVLIEVETCEPGSSEPPSGSGSGPVSPSDPPISEPPL